MIALFDLDGFKQYNDLYGHSAGDELLARLGARLETTMQGVGVAYRMGGDEFCVLAPAGSDGGESIARLAAAALTDEGTGFVVGCSYGIALLPADTSDATAALTLADQRMYAQKAAGRSSAGRQSADVLLRVLAERNIELERHIAGVAALAASTARQLGMADDDIRRIELAAQLHDVGKAAIPDAILDKPGPLDDEERRFIERHTVIGERIVLAAPSLAAVAPLIRSSHERVDGTGYPDGLAGEDIPLGARVIAVCDAYEAMIAERPYSAPCSHEEALAELRRCAGGQFDADVVEAFCAIAGRPLQTA
jgi:diguanylate cyclase (GGDEF)-like protein